MVRRPARCLRYGPRGAAGVPGPIMGVVSSPGTPTRGDGTLELLGAGPLPPTWHERWSATALRARTLILLSAVLAVVAVALGVAAAHAQPRYRLRTMAGPAPSAPGSTDAVGCPVTARCTVLADALPSLRAAFLRAFPGGRVLAAQRTVELSTGRVYRADLEGLIGERTTVQIASQCVPNAPAPPDRVVSGANAHKELSGDITVESRQVTVVAGGSPGCGAFLWLDSFDLGRNYQQAAVELARDTTIQLGR